MGKGNPNPKPFAGPGPGRPPGSKNKVSKLLRDAVLEAADLAGGKKGLVGYLKKQATGSPSAFIALLGRILPTQLAGDLKIDAAARVEVTYATLDDAKAAAIEKGVPAEVIERILGK